MNLVKAHGMGKDIWTLPPDEITEVVKVSSSLCAYIPNDSNLPYLVHMGYPSILHPCHHLNQDHRLVFLLACIPCARVSDGLLGYNRPLRPVHGINNNCGNSRLRPCRIRLGCLDWDGGGCML